MIILEKDDSVRKVVERKTYARKWLLRSQEKSAFCIIFEELTMKTLRDFVNS